MLSSLLPKLFQLSINENLSNCTWHYTVFDGGDIATFSWTFLRLLPVLLIGLCQTKYTYARYSTRKASRVIGYVVLPPDYVLSAYNKQIIILHDLISKWIAFYAHAVTNCEQSHFNVELTILRSRYQWGRVMAERGKKVMLSLYHSCDSTTIRLRHDYEEKLTCSFFARVESRRMEAGARDTS